MAAVVLIGYFTLNKTDKESFIGSVKKTGDSTFEIAQNELDRMFGNVDEVLSEARVVPAFEGDKSIGFEFVYIKPESIFNKIGLNIGDVVTAINKIELDSPDMALEALTSLKEAKRFNIAFKRADISLNFEYIVKS